MHIHVGWGEALLSATKCSDLSRTGVTLLSRVVSLSHSMLGGPNVRLKLGNVYMHTFGVAQQSTI